MKPSAENRPVIQTERLALRPLEETDADALRRISNEPDVRRYLWDDEPVPEAAILDVIAGSKRSFSESGVGFFGVRFRGSEVLLGFCGFGQTTGGPEETEIVYELSSRLWGRGLATEAARACLRYAFMRTNLKRVVAGADAPNVASLRVIEKLGMKPVGEIAPGQPGVPFFALSRDDFLAAAGGAP